MSTSLKREAAAPEGVKSWFGALDLGESTLDLGTARAPRAGVERERRDEEPAWSGHPMRRATDRQETGFARLLRVFLTARALLGLALLGTELVIAWFGSRPQRELMLALCSLYAMAALASWWRRPEEAPGRDAQAPFVRLRRRGWLATIGVDLLIFSILQFVNAGAGGFNYSALLVLPVMTASVLTPRLQALGVAAASALVILASAVLAMGASSDGAVAFTQAGLAALGLFVVSLLAGELSGRLAREELAARGSMELARRQAQLNRLVLEEMQDGVMVVDRRGRVRAANPAARSLLGEPVRKTVAGTEADNLALTGNPAWEPLVRAVDRAFAEGHWPEAGRDVVLGRLDPNGDSGVPKQLRLRVRFTRRAASGTPEDYCVLFLEDLRIVQARLRQEKLAAMGRVSAGIAHEIRNPLAAIMQANDLLAEEAATPQQQRLMRMVSENALRLKRIVDDVMEIAPGATAQPVPIDATAQVAVIGLEWARTAKLPPAGGPLDLQLPDEPLEVMFDAEHLRRVLVNLLDNALRHGSRDRAAVRVRLAAESAERASLEVASDGDPIATDVERYLFEPFFSTRSRGTGLGLYICRELCERYGASIDYAARRLPERHRNVFTVSMRRALPGTTGAA